MQLLIPSVASDWLVAGGKQSKPLRLPPILLFVFPQLFQIWISNWKYGSFYPTPVLPLYQGDGATTTTEQLNGEEVICSSLSSAGVDQT